MIREKVVVIRRQNICPCNYSNGESAEYVSKPLCCSAGFDVLEMAKAQLLLTAFPGTKGFESK
jgi:hypothetical protein